MARFITKTVCTALITVLCVGSVFAQGGTYDIITLANPAPAGVVVGGGTYNYGEFATVTAIPDSCYKFVNWTEDGVVLWTEPVYAFVVTADRVLTANFALTRNGYEIIVLANPSQGGTVTGGGIYSCSEVATVKAIPDTCCCYEFVNWTENGEVVSTAAFYTFIVAGDRVLIANFALKTLDITLVADPPEGGEVFGDGEVICFSTTFACATPNDCYEFLYWSEDGVAISMDACYAFIALQDHNLVAHFAPKNYDISIFTDPPEGGTVVGGGIYSCASIDSICAFAAPCYEFVSWTENGEVVSMDMCYAFEVTGDRTLVANFVPKRDGCEIIVVANPPEGGTVTGGGAYDCGVPVLVTATPAEGYMFVSWTENDVEISDDAFYSFSVATSRTLVANFAGMTAIGEVETSGITIYPNPTSGALRVTSYELQVTNVEIFDLFGRICNVSRVTRNENEIDISFLPSGIYFIRIQTENSVVVRKVVKR